MRPIRFRHVALILAVIALLLNCGHEPPATTVATAAVAKYLRDKSAQTGDTPLGDTQETCWGCKYDVTIERLEIGKFNTSTQGWPVRTTMTIHCRCGDKSHQVTKDYMLVPDGFGE